MYLIETSLDLQEQDEDQPLNVSATFLRNPSHDDVDNNEEIVGLSSFETIDPEKKTTSSISSQLTEKCYPQQTTELPLSNLNKEFSSHLNTKENLPYEETIMENTTSISDVAEEHQIDDADDHNTVVDDGRESPWKTEITEEYQNVKHYLNTEVSLPIN